MLQGRADALCPPSPSIDRTASPTDNRPERQRRLRERARETRITVEGERTSSMMAAALQSSATSSGIAERKLVDDVLALFSYSADDLDPRLPSAVAEAGARHLVLALNSREKLSTIRYDFEVGRSLMTSARIVTISLASKPRPPPSSMAATRSLLGACMRILRRELQPQPWWATCVTLAGRTAEPSTSSRAKTWVCRRGYGQRSHPTGNEHPLVRGSSADVRLYKGCLRQRRC